MTWHRLFCILTLEKTVEKMFRKIMKITCFGRFNLLLTSGTYLDRSGMVDLPYTKSLNTQNIFLIIFEHFSTF